jgi:hypothetical protein
MVSEIHLACSQQLAKEAYPVPDENNPHPQAQFPLDVFQYYAPIYACVSPLLC